MNLSINPIHPFQDNNIYQDANKYHLYNYIQVPYNRYSFYKLHNYIFIMLNF